MLAMGDLYYYGARGLPRDQGLALNYFNQAAHLGDPTGMCGAAAMYLKGEGTTMNVSKAVELYENATRNGTIRAYNGLGYLYFYGSQVPKNETKAFEYFQIAAQYETDGDSLIPVDNKLSSSSSTGASSAVSLLVVYEKAIHLKEKRKYLLKIFPFYSLQKYQEDQIRKEKELLKYFNSLGSSSIEEGNTNIIKLIDCNLLTSRQSDKMNFFVLEWMDMSLQEYWDSLINERKDFASSVIERYDHMIKIIMKDILQAVLLLHKNDIVHR
jgi:serine/threonine protein kinase